MPSDRAARIDSARPGTVSRNRVSWIARQSSSLAALALVFVYDISMRENEVTEEQIQQWADEGEAGYDVEQLKSRGRGRPGRGAEPMQVVAVRLTADELAALDAVAGRDKVSRSEAIRRALAHFTA